MALLMVLAMVLGALPQNVLAEELSSAGASVQAEDVEGESVSAQPEESDPGEPAENAPAESEPEESGPVESEPEESTPGEPAENVPAESEPAESAPAASEPTESACVDTQSDPEPEQSAEESAPEAEGGQGQILGTVTGFPDQGPVVRLNIPEDNRPSLEALLKKLPEELTVEVQGVACAIPVSWFCVGDDYGDAEGYYYQFSPRWDEQRWPLAQGLDVVRDAPYAAVFVTLPGLQTQTAQSVELHCYRFFTETMGLNPAAACGILANIYNECAFKPNNLQQYYENKLGYTDESYTEAVDNGTYKNFVHDSAGYGLVQFTWWEYKRDFLAYAKKKGKSIGDTQTQLEYLRISMGAGRIKKLKGFPNTKQGAYDAGKYFCDSYERPGLKDQPVKRARLARDTFWPKYKDAYARAENGLPNALSAPVLLSLKATKKGACFTWEGVTGATKYRVFSDQGSGWTKLGETKEMSWTQEPLTSGKVCAFTVCCLNSKGQKVSAYDTEGLSLTFWAAPTLTKCGNTPEGIQLRWSNENSPSYLVYRKPYGGKWETPVPVTGTTTTYTDTTVEPGKWYVYAVRCADENSKALSSYVTGERVIRLPVPQMKTPLNKAKGILVRWGASTGATGFKVFRKSGKERWQCVATVKGAKTLSWLDKSVQKKNGTHYRYTVRALNGSVLSGYEAQGKLCCRLNAPTLTSVKALKEGKLSAKWKKNGKATGYDLLWKSGKKQEAVVVQGKLGHTFKGLKKGKYQVYVRAWRREGEQMFYSDWSAGKKVKL